MRDIDVLNEQFWLMLASSILCGGILGIERQIHGKPAGMRTSILICLGTALFVQLGADLAVGGGDPTRVLGQVVTGIGFLGGGVIITQGGLIRGMTSAAVIWILAAIGAAIGVGRRLEAIAITLVSTLVLVGVQALERTFRSLPRGEQSDEPDEPRNGS